MVASPQSSRFELKAPSGLKHRTTNASVSISQDMTAQDQPDSHGVESGCGWCVSRGYCGCVNWSWWFGGWLRTRVARIVVSVTVALLVLMVTVVLGHQFLVRVRSILRHLQPAQSRHRSKSVITALPRCSVLMANPRAKTAYVRMCADGTS